MTLPVGFGTWGLGGRAYGEISEAEASRVVEHALKLGLRMFDTADIYGEGRAERILGEVLSGVPDAIIISKGGYLSESDSEQNFSYSALSQSLEESLKRLRRDHLDVYLLHSPSKQFLEDGEGCHALDRLREEGYTRKTGVSLRTFDTYPAAAQWSNCAVIEVVYNLLDQRFLDAGFSQAASKRGMEVIARVPLCFGFLSGQHTTGETFGDLDQRHRWPRQQIDNWVTGARRFLGLTRPDRSLIQTALAFCIQSPGFTYAIPGMKTPAQVEHNLAACGSGGALTPEEWHLARKLWADMKGLAPS